MQWALREDAPVQTATLLNASSPTGSITFPRELALSLWHLLKRAHLSGGGAGGRGGWHGLLLRTHSRRTRTRAGSRTGVGGLGSLRAGQGGVGAF